MARKERLLLYQKSNSLFIFIVFNHIDKIRRKPEHVRKRIAFFVTLAIFSIIIFFWFYFVRIDIISQKKVKSNVNIISPFVNVKNTFGQIFSGINQSTKTIRNVFLNQ